MLEQLARDHLAVGGMLRQLDQLVTSVHDVEPVSEHASVRIQGELDGLAAVLESHFRYEEKALTGALAGLDIDIPG